nr:hypothetical protein [Streptomyces flavofungini]
MARAPLGAAVVVLWSWATLLIPVLPATGVWRHLRHRVPLAYEPALWCIVFPLGMYATATAHLTAAHLAAAQRIGASTLPQRPLAWVALAAWVAVGTRWLTGRWAPGRPSGRPAARA